MSAEDLKKAAAEHAVKVVDRDVKIGLGTGSTANYFIKAAAEKVKRENLNTVFVATSTASETLAKSLGLDVKSLEEVPLLDFCVDGADEIDPQFRMIKGGGGAHLREKIVASSSKFVVCIADESKMVETLGKFPLPVEVSRFGVNATAMKLGALLRNLGYEGVQMRLRATVLDKPFITDSGNPIIDLKLEKIKDPALLAQALESLPGVVDHGLFIDICGVAMLGTAKGVEEITRPPTGTKN